MKEFHLKSGSVVRICESNLTAEQRKALFETAMMQLIKSVKSEKEVNVIEAW